MCTISSIQLFELISLYNFNFSWLLKMYLLEEHLFPWIWCSAVLFTKARTWRMCFFRFVFYGQTTLNGLNMVCLQLCLNLYTSNRTLPCSTLCRLCTCLRNIWIYDRAVFYKWNAVSVNDFALSLNEIRNS